MNLQSRRATLFHALSVAFMSCLLTGCPPMGGNGNGNDNGNGNGNDNGNSNGNGNDNVSQTISADTELAALTIPDGQVVLIENDAVVTVTGDAMIAGTLRAADGRVTLRVQGDLEASGRIEASGDAPSDDDADAPLSAQPTGVFIIVGDGAVTFTSDAEVVSNGPVVLTDDDALLDSTPAQLYDEVEDVSGDDLPTLVPLPPDNDAFDDLDNGVPKRATPIVLQGMLPPVTVSGVWPPAGMVVPGDRPVIIVRFMGNRPVNIDGWTVNGPAAPPGNDADNSADPGNSASGRSGKRGMRLNITNNGGPINIVNAVTLNLADGGDGGSATAICANATGGPGGLSGNMRMTASGGVDIRNGTLTINPGRAGAGGAAFVDPGAAGAAGCPGANVAGGTAEGGDGADNRKRLFVRGNVQGIENISIGALSAGDGGGAVADVCDGGPGVACCDGGAGGAATARGGDGGEASLNIGALPITVGGAFGGNGGEAEAFGAFGGDGGDCKIGDGGDGGDGGAATATGGAGGAATNSTGAATGGDGGNATATGGDGGAGGDSGLGTPGTGGAPGMRTATAGNGGAATTAGQAGEIMEIDGNTGAGGGDINIIFYCLTFADFLQSVGGTIPPGTAATGPVVDLDSQQIVGMIGIEFVDQTGASYQSSPTPLPHVGLSGGAIRIDVNSLMLDAGPAGDVIGLRIEPLFGNGLTETTPLVIEALGADGVVLDTQTLAELPDNFNTPSNPQSVDVSFNTDGVVEDIVITAPPGAFVTLIRVYLIDP